METDYLLKLDLWAVSRQFSMSNMLGMYVERDYTEQKKCSI